MQYSKSKAYPYALNSKNSSFKKGTLSKYTSYSNLIKSQDNLLEKQRLKEENWKLKNLSNSLSEENKKLREKLSKRFSVLEQPSDKQFHIVNYNSNIEKIKADIAKARDELESVIAENTDLTSKLSKQADKKTSEKIFQPEVLKIRSDSKKHAELTNEKKIISDLNREISELTVTLQSLTTKNISYKDQISSHRTLVESPKKKIFQIAKGACFSVLSQLESLSNEKKLSVEERSSDCSELS